MLNKIAKLSLVTTSIAPILLTLWFKEFSQAWCWQDGCWYLGATLILVFICWVLINVSKCKLEKLPVKIVSVKTADKEVVNFILIYLLPLINITHNIINLPVLLFVAGMFFYIVATSNAYHVNPLLNILGYHFYEVTIEGGISYVLITKRNIANCKIVSEIVQLSEYMILEV
jgi:MFS family permease